MNDDQYSTSIRKLAITVDDHIPGCMPRKVTIEDYTDDCTIDVVVCLMRDTLLAMGYSDKTVEEWIPAT